MRVPVPPPRRVVSLLPAATEIVAALGAWDRLVGVSHECDYPAQALTLPRVTASRVTTAAPPADIDREVRGLAAGGKSLFSIDADVIRQLKPDLMVTQGLCEVCAVSEADVRRLAATLPQPCNVLSLGATTLNGVFDSIASVAAALGDGDEGSELVDGLRYQLRTIHQTLAASRAPRPRVAVIEWTDPVFAAGHWVPDMVSRAGGTDALASPGQHSAAISAEQVRQARPERLIFAPCGFDLVRSHADALVTLNRPEWAWAAGIAAWVVDGNAMTSRPGPRLCTGVATFARILHPQLFGAPLPDRARSVQSTI